MAGVGAAALRPQLISEFHRLQNRPAMPTYVYRRTDGTTFEITQRITEDALTTCPETGQAVSRVISGAGLIFKGSGFYLTDYARNNGNGKAKEADSKPAGDSGSLSTSADSPAPAPTASETKSAA
jgi:putative FmdB family regulatory protein